MSTKPIPAPRGEGKKPIPTPRKKINKFCQTETNSCQCVTIQNNENNFVQIPPTLENIEEKSVNMKINSDKEEKNEQFNTFSRRMSNVSKQIAGDIGQLVQDRKKAVIASTRQSVRRLTRRFSSVSQEQKYKQKDDENGDLEGTLQMFNNIKFESPLSRTNSIYSNIENELMYSTSTSSTESINLPPPVYPPPSLPENSAHLYDAPASLSPICSSSNSSSNSSNNQPLPQIKQVEDYECIFTKFPSSNNNNNNNNNMEPSSDRNDNPVDNANLSRSDSWAYYDTVSSTTSKNQSQENIYGNINHPKTQETEEPKQLTEDQSEPAILKPEKLDENAKSDITLSRSVSCASDSHTNSVYENYDVVFPRNHSNGETPIRMSKSILMQFDPLNQDSSTEFSDMNLLEEILQGDLYSSISDAFTFDQWSISNDSENEEFRNPPTPPLRVDSLPDETDETDETAENGKSSEDQTDLNISKMKSAAATATSRKSRSNWFTDGTVASSSATEPKKNWLKQVFEKAPVILKSHKPNEEIVDRPVLAGKNKNKRGMLYKVQSGPVEDLFGEYSCRWCVLEGADLVCYSDNTCSSIKEHFSAANILSIQHLQDAKYKYRHDNEDLYCFELNVTGKSRGGHIYGSRVRSDRRIWMQLIVEMMTQRFKSKITSNYIRFGWAYIREGISGKWSGAWIILSERELSYAIDGHSVKTMDLRKARCIKLQGHQYSEVNPRTNDSGPNMLIDWPNLTLYLRMWTSRETKVWCHIIKKEAHNNGANLDEQQLTRNDIPVLVEKCINFIYAHGSMSEGIYRKAGTGSLIAELLSKFRKDAFSVQLTRNDYTEYEVGTALKRFFRDLPEPLFGCDHRLYLYEVAKHNVKDEKIRMFKAALDQLPLVSYNTAKKLLGHLHFIAMQSKKNLMSIENLAAIWGPTLMYYDDKDGHESRHIQDADVVGQLIKYYKYVFPEDPDELEKEKLMLKVLEKHMESPQGQISNKSAGDFRVWIYLFKKDGPCYNLSIGPSRTAYNVCIELSEKMDLQIHEIILEEVVLSERLSRPIHHSEKVLDVVLKWSYWDDADKKDNYLMCVPILMYNEYLIERPVLPISGELRFADNKTKTLKSLTFQLSQGRLSCFKDKTNETVLYSWPVENIIWYLGHEVKRIPHPRWALTFLETGTKPKRTKNSPFFGNILVWDDAASRANWFSALLKAKYPNNLAPPARLISI